jgi:uncharacterized protein YlbG (UPF0298 family)
MFPERTGLILWVQDLKAIKSLKRFGTIHYMSRKMNYIVMYVNADKAEETMKQISKLPFVKKIEKSYRNEIRTEYNSNIPDKTRFYTY